MNLVCKYCGKTCKNANSLRNHERLCKFNPNHQTTIFQNKEIREKIVSWNKGLTKETDERLKRFSENLKGRVLSPYSGRASTDEREKQRREKISRTMKCRHLGGFREHSGRGHKGKYKGYYCDSTYELVWIIYNIDHNIKFERCQFYYTYKVDEVEHKYYPDFVLENGSLVEIKGYHTKQVDLKIASVTDRPIKVLYEKDLKYAFSYVKNHYKVKNVEDLYQMEDELEAAF